MSSSEEDQTAPGASETAPASVSMLPERHERPPLESAFVRVIATCGVVGIGVALGAILTSQKVAGWIVGLVIALVAVILSAILWSSRRL
jgi:protein-S-isoprenylcysteine O-methyltransferase Ste14